MRGWGYPSPLAHLCSTYVWPARLWLASHVARRAERLPSTVLRFLRSLKCTHTVRHTHVYTATGSLITPSSSSSPGSEGDFVTSSNNCFLNKETLNQRAVVAVARARVGRIFPRQPRMECVKGASFYSNCGFWVDKGTTYAYIYTVSKERCCLVLMCTFPVHTFIVELLKQTAFIMGSRGEEREREKKRGKGFRVIEHRFCAGRRGRKQERESVRDLRRSLRMKTI